MTTTAEAPQFFPVPAVATHGDFQGTPMLILHLSSTQIAFPYEHARSMMATLTRLVEERCNEYEQRNVKTTA